MSSTPIIVFMVVVLIIAAAAAAGWFYLRRRTLQQKFGPEYDRVVADGGNRIAAERELLDRERRHAELDIRPLEPAARERYADDWRAVQTLFVEDPARAVESGDEIVTRLVAERGYPTENYEDQLSYLSVEHARTLGHYRDAHDIYLRGQRGEASTEELRQALVHYRELFADVLGDASLATTSHDPAAPDTDAATLDTGTADASGHDPARHAPVSASEPVADTAAQYSGAANHDPSPHDTPQR